MVEGALLGIVYLIVTWFLYTQWRRLPALYLSLGVTTVAWLPSLMYANKMLHYAGYVILSALVVWIVSEKLGYQRGVVHK